MPPFLRTQKPIARWTAILNNCLLTFALHASRCLWAGYFRYGTDVPLRIEQASKALLEQAAADCRPLPGRPRPLTVQPAELQELLRKGLYPASNNPVIQARQRAKSNERQTNFAFHHQSPALTNSNKQNQASWGRTAWNCNCSVAQDPPYSSALF